jgi:hypothetical protein
MISLCVCHSRTRWRIYSSTSCGDGSLLGFFTIATSMDIIFGPHRPDTYGGLMDKSFWLFVTMENILECMCG